MAYSAEVFEDKDHDIDLYDIEWLMSNIDLEAVLGRLNVDVQFRRGSWLWGYCPDHHLFVGREPSHPKWSINEETGMCKCFTEPRVSNLIFTIARLKNISAMKAVEWAVGYSVHSVEATCSRIKKLVSPKNPLNKINSFDISKYKNYIENGELGRNSIALLAKNGIIPETAKEFGCVEFQDGYYHDRMIFPVKNINQELKGFIATNTLTKEEWLERNPTTVDRSSKRIRPTTDEDYKKVLYPSNFKIGNYLIGEDCFKKRDIAILVEGCRDVLKLKQEGFSGALGIGGTSLSEDQYITLSKLCPKKIILMLDGDEAGRMGAEAIANNCLDLLQEVFIVKLKGVDPKDLSREEILFHMRHKTERIYGNPRKAWS